MISRRSLFASVLALPPALRAARELSCDVAVIGGGVGGCAAALGALRNGMRVAMTEETDWIGGQLTSQMVPPDENGSIETGGGTALYREYRKAVRDYYKRYYPLTADARGRERLNPGDGSVSRLTHEPRVSLAVLEGLLAPYASGGKFTLLLNAKPVRADVSGDQVRAVTLSGGKTISAKYFIDATEQGDLLPLTKTEYVTGFESRKQTGEPHAPEQAQPRNIQSFTYCFAMDYLEGADHTVDKPADYKFWRDYMPALKPAWSGKLLSWTVCHPITLAKREMSFDPTMKSKVPAGGANLWQYRRIASKANFTAGAYDGDISLVNWPQNDYWLGNLHEVSEAEKAKHLRGGKQLSLSFLYWMQTEAPRPDGGAGWRGLRLRPDLAGTEDGLAKYPYIRESRRIQSEFTVLEQHVGKDARKADTAEQFADTVGIGSYRIDLHPSTAGDNYIDVASLPFQIPMGALMPKRVNNLLAGAKNLGVTHITNGCYRLHPVEWNIGESAGALAAHAVAAKLAPRQIRNDKALLAEFQAKLTAQGVMLAWPK